MNNQGLVTLRSVLPREFFTDGFMFIISSPHISKPSNAAKLLDRTVVAVHDGRINPWPGIHKNVVIWWELDNGKAVGFNENPATGWSFPVCSVKK